MLKRKSLSIAALFLVTVSMTAGCAKQDVVKKDEGFVPAPASRRADQSKSDLTPSNQSSTTPVSQVTTPLPDPAQEAQKTTSNAQLQSALQKIYFDFDSADLSESARGTLTNNNAALIKGSSAKIRIEGNCDQNGSAEYNLALGERRAKSAQQYLIALGVKPERLTTVSYGKEKPAVQGSDEAARSKNRRDEFVVVN
ncbi:MAG: peptidoglycan-associated lipoprotein Pal [Steroidobacteraceae bacterium]|nr:peptidoglycan-associated lipoprotein Pal [Deltaproteobacteria bacterium]